MPTVNDVTVQKPDSELKAMCETWPIWSCDVSEFEWEYTQTEKCLLLEGQVTVTDLPDTGHSVSFGVGDYVVFPNGLKCIWKVQKPVRKHYDFE